MTGTTSVSLGSVWEICNVPKTEKKAPAGLFGGEKEDES